MMWVFAVIVLINLSIFVAKSDIEESKATGYWAVLTLVVIGLLVFGFITVR